MKKYGFTLAEVLITLTIIGVVAAITTPSLNSNIQKNKVGPALSKFINTLENAHETMIANGDVDRLSDLVGKNADTYMDKLSTYAKGMQETKTIADFAYKPASYTGVTNSDPAPYYELTNYPEDTTTTGIYNFADGSSMAFYLYNPGTTLVKGAYKGNIASVWFDINGFDKKPNKAGKDEFKFYIDNSGSVYPDGGKVKKSMIPEAYTWEDATNTRNACNDKISVGTGVYCGASVVDNNFKVIYKY